MALDALEGRTYGPVGTRIIDERVRDFVAATDDDPDRWRSAAPPGYGAVLLFAVAPLLVDEVGDRARVLVHTEQRFTWHHPLALDLAVVVEGTVTRVRTRGSLSFVELEVVATSDGEPLMESSSTFLMGAEPVAAPGVERVEPDVRAGSLPGEQGTATRRGASRVDLVRYAAASGDFNPIHFDHDAARAAGLDGIVVHGLLMAAWLAQAAATHAGRIRTDPLQEMRLRFRAPLHPGDAAEVSCLPGPEVDGLTTLAVALRRGGVDLVTATAVARTTAVA